MNSMHERVLQALDSQLGSINCQESLTRMATLERHIDQYDSRMPPTAKLEFVEGEQNPTLTMPEELRKRLSERQQAELDELIAAYVEGGLQLLYGVGKIVRDLSLYDNSAQMQQIDRDIKDMYDLPEGHFSRGQNATSQEDESESDEGQQQQNQATKPEPTRLHQELPIPNGKFNNMMQPKIQESAMMYQQQMMPPGIQTEMPERRSSISAFARSFGRKKKAALSEQQIENLEFDLKNPNLTKQQIQKKYDISESTLNRYVRRFRQWEEEANSLQYQQQQILIQQQQIQLQKQMQLQHIQQQQLNIHQAAQVPFGMPQNRQHMPIQPPSGLDLRAIEGRRSKVKMVQSKVIEIYKKFPNIYQSEVAEMLSKHFRTDISIHVVSRCLKHIQNKKHQRQQMGLPAQEDRKKRQIIDINDPRVINIRFSFSQDFLRRDPTKLIFVDEMEHRNDASRPESAWKAINIALAVNYFGKLVASKVKIQHFNAEQICAFFEEIVKDFPQIILVVDQAKLHKERFVQQAMQAKRVEIVYIPHFSPYLNPVEKVFPQFIAQFNRRVSSTAPAEEALKIARQTILQLKECNFSKEVEASRRFVEMGSRQQPFPSNKTDKMTA